MKRIVLTLLTALLLLPASGAASYNLDSLYAELDKAISESDTYVRRKTDRMDGLKEQLARATEDATRYELAENLYAEYSAFCNDSAVHYLNLCLTLAERMGRADLKNKALVNLAYQHADTGYYTEAQQYFARVDRAALTGDVLRRYYGGQNHLYGEMGYYSRDERMSRQFHDRSTLYRDSLLALLDTNGVEYVGLRSMVLNNVNELDAALRYSDRWLALSQPDTRNFAIMAFFRSEIYKKQGDTDAQRYWLIRAALSDIHLAIMDQGALWSLAQSLSSEGDVERAYRYVDFSWNCISRFSTHMRAWTVSPILTMINDNYKAQLQRANRRLWMLVAAVSLLALVVLASLLVVSRKRRQLAVAQGRVAAANEELKVKNEALAHQADELQALNAQLSTLNTELRDANRVKDEYITKFLQLCSEYIDKLDNYRIKINRKLKANQYDDLKKMTSSDSMKEEELKELFDNFDSVFLHLFPTFIDDFNALLKPENRIVPTEENRLTTDLRIFALIRLGIDESSRIADFLRYSPNSIYNYRARIKNKAVCERDEFERRVKQLGQ